MKNLKLIKPIHIAGVTAGAVFSAVAVKSFVRAADLVPAGVGGVSVLLIKELQTFFNITLSYGLVYFVLNVVLLAFVYQKLGKKFLFLSFLHVILTSIFVEVIPAFRLTSDPILLAIFGGVMNGIGSSLALRVNGSAGGTDFIAIYFSMVKNKPMWDKIMMFNVAVLIYSGWRYRWDLALYSIMYQMASTKIIDTYHNRYKLSSITIITSKPDIVSEAVFAVTRHGITKTDGVGMYSDKYKAFLYMVVNDFETNGVVNAIKNADPKAFIEISSVDRIEGNYRQKPLD